MRAGPPARLGRGRLAGQPGAGVPATLSVGRPAACGCSGASREQEAARRQRWAPAWHLRPVPGRMWQRSWLQGAGRWALRHCAHVSAQSGLKDPAEDSGRLSLGSGARSVVTLTYLLVEGRSAQSLRWAETSSLSLSLTERNLHSSLYSDPRRKQLNHFSISAVGQKRKKKINLFSISSNGGKM